MVKNFRFEQPEIALSGFPQSAAEVDWLHDQGISSVVSLHPVPEEAQQRIDAVFEHLDQIEAGSPALIHCQGGGGRAGTFYAAYLISRGATVDEAIARVPGVTRDEQRAFIHGFAAGRQSKA
jgi:protein-tyrosine phosphatase